MSEASDSDPVNDFGNVVTESSAAMDRRTVAVRRTSLTAQRGGPWRGRHDRPEVAVNVRPQAKVKLEQAALAGHPLAAAAMARPTSRSLGRQAGPAQNALQALAADAQPFTLGEQLGEVAVVCSCGSARTRGRRWWRADRRRAAVARPARGCHERGRPVPRVRRPAEAATAGAARGPAPRQPRPSSARP